MGLKLYCSLLPTYPAVKCLYFKISWISHEKNFWVIDLLLVSFCMKFVTYCSCHSALFFLKSTGQLYSKASSVVELGWLVTSALLTSCPVPIHYYIVIDMLLSFVHFNTWLFWVSLYRTRVWISLYDCVLGWNSIRFTLAVCFVFKFEPRRFWLLGSGCS